MKITIEFDSIEQAQLALSVLSPPEPLAKQFRGPKKETPAAAEPVQAGVVIAQGLEAATIAKAAAPEKVAEAKSATREEAAAAIVALNKKKGRAAAVAVLELFRPAGLPKEVDGAIREVKLPDVVKENYAALIAEANKALAE